MTCESAVCINDDLSSRKTRVSLRSAYNKTTRRIYIDLSILINQLGRDYRCDNLILNELLKFFA